jgi:hypothetical protein
LVVQRDAGWVSTRHIGVVLLHELAVGSLDNLAIGIGVHLQDRVVIAVG